jgi:hypothetical protein
MLRRYGDKYFEKHNLTALRPLASLENPLILPQGNGILKQLEIQVPYNRYILAN